MVTLVVPGGVQRECERKAFVSKQCRRVVVIFEDADDVCRCRAKALQKVFSAACLQLNGETEEWVCAVP